MRVQRRDSLVQWHPICRFPLGDSLNGVPQVTKFVIARCEAFQDAHHLVFSTPNPEPARTLHDADNMLATQTSENGDRRIVVLDRVRELLGGGER